MATDTYQTHTRRSPKVVLWTALWLTVYFVGISLLSAIDGPDGKPWVDTNVLGESVKTLGLIGAALGPSIINLLRDTRTVKHEVKNDHSTNLRVENDSRHEETRQWFAELRKDINGIRSELRSDRQAVRDGFSRVDADLREHSERIHSMQKKVRNGTGRVGWPPCRVFTQRRS